VAPAPPSVRSIPSTNVDLLEHMFNSFFEFKKRLDDIRPALKQCFMQKAKLLLQTVQ
jgi:hypothetical protein